MTFLYFDGAKKNGNRGNSISGGGWVIINGNNEYEGYDKFSSNLDSNDAEFLALCRGLHETYELFGNEQITSLEILGDSKVVIDMMNGKTRSIEKYIHYSQMIRHYLYKLGVEEKTTFKHIKRMKNSRADSLAKLATEV